MQFRKPGKASQEVVEIGKLSRRGMLKGTLAAVFGGLGSAGYVGHLAYEVFKDSMVFPFVLTAIGLGVIYLGILWQRHEQAITSRLRAFLPAPLRDLVERRQ
jgi:hypothetical protein